MTPRPNIRCRPALTVVAVVTVALTWPPPVRAGAPRCGATAEDRATIASVRASVEDACPCASATTPHSYVACVAQAATGAVKSGTLPRRCRGVVIKAAKRSTCGRPGAVTCCTAHDGGRERCHIASAATRCRARHGGSASVGGAFSCYDACLPSCDELQLSDIDVKAAADRAIAAVSDPWASVGVIVERAAAALGCRPSQASTTTGGGLQRQAEGDSCVPGGPIPCYCDTHYCPDTAYCGQSTSQHAGGVACCSDGGSECLNRACLEHDLCYDRNCIQSACTFGAVCVNGGSGQSLDCDAALIDACLSCPHTFSEIIICEIVVTAETVVRPPSCCQPPCGGGSCDPGTGMCAPTTTTMSGTTSTTSTTLTGVVSVHIDSAVCNATPIGGGLEQITYTAMGSASGPVGTRLDLNGNTQLSCTSWAPVSCGALVCCARQDGQPERTQWTDTLDTFGMTGEFIEFVADAVLAGTPPAHDRKTTNPCP